MKKKYLKYGIITAVILILAGTFYVTAIKNNENEVAGNQLEYATVEVIKGNIKTSITGSGNATASERKEVKAQNTGTVEEVFVIEGQKIEKGDLILSFESDLEETDIQRAELNLKNAKNELEEIERDIQNLKIYAEGSGSVGEIDVKVGDQVSDGYTLTTITDKSRMETTAKFNTVQVSNIQVGDKAEVVLPSSFQTITGTITKIEESSNASESGGITYNVVVEIETPGGIVDGASAQVTVKNDKGNFSALENTTLNTKETETVKVEQGGEITKLYISSGDIVKEGELLAELENTSLQKQLESQNLLIQESILNLNEKLKQKEDVAVYSPISGTVLDIGVTSEEAVGENTVVATIADLVNMEVVIPIDELDISKVKEGQKAIVTAEAIEAIEYTAEVTQIAIEGTTSDSVTTYDVKLSIDNPKQLKTGMTLNVELVIESKNDVLLLPIEAVQQQGKNQFVLQKDDSKEDTTKKTNIEIGLVSENYVEITKGLEEGSVVLYPTARPTSQSEIQNQKQPGGLVPGMPGGFGNDRGMQGGNGNVRTNRGN